MAVEIPRYLADPEQSVTLRNGASVRVRAIRPDDEPRLLALCQRLSPRTVYERFFSPRRLLPEEAHAFANVDYRQRMAVVAEVDDGPEPELVGVARYGIRSIPTILFFKAGAVVDRVVGAAPKAVLQDIVNARA